MSTRYPAHPSIRVTASRGDGYTFGFWLPPLAIVSIGAILMFFTLHSTTFAAPTEIPPAQAKNDLIVGSFHSLSPVFTTEVQYWAEMIQVWAAAAGLDPNLVATVMQIESCGDPRALSRAGAMGLFQVMPYHFTASDDPYAPDTNALRGLAYLRRSQESARGDVRLALAGYNGGIGVINWAESEWPAQTQNYAYWGSGIYSDASNGLRESPHLQEWLVTNGISLCRQAHDRLGISP